MEKHSEAKHHAGLPPVLHDREFGRFSSFIYEEIGIKLPPAKRTMLEARLHKRLKKLELSSFSDYADYVFSPQGRAEELVHLLDVVTTNKTDFFREPAHFSFLVKSVIPELASRRGCGLRSAFRIWSAGCSSGEEPYTMAMVLSEYAEQNHGFRFSILATDISTAVLDKARTAIYSEENADTIPLNLKKKYLLKSRDRSKGLVRVIPALRSMVNFRRLNFMQDFGMSDQLDVIFCRNVIIYFDKPTQERLLNKFCNQLVTGGYLFLGHSESINGLNVPLKAVSSTTYQKI